METRSQSPVLVVAASAAVFVLTWASCSLAGVFDGKSLEGWRCEPGANVGHWEVEDGMIVGENPDKKGSVLWTEKEYADFDIELEYMTPSKDYDSGVFARGKTHQVQIGVSRSLRKDLTACIYAPRDKAGKYPAQSDKVATVHKPGEWNKLRIVVRGKRIQTFLNGEAFVDYEGKAIAAKGPIGLQLHGGVHMKMLFRNISLKELE